MYWRIKIVYYRFLFLIIYSVFYFKDLAYDWPLTAHLNEFLFPLQIYHFFFRYLYSKQDYSELCCNYHYHHQHQENDGVVKYIIELICWYHEGSRCPYFICIICRKNRTQRITRIKFVFACLFLLFYLKLFKKYPNERKLKKRYEWNKQNYSTFFFVYIDFWYKKGRFKTFPLSQKIYSIYSYGVSKTWFYFNISIHYNCLNLLLLVKKKKKKPFIWKVFFIFLIIFTRGKNHIHLADFVFNLLRKYSLRVYYLIDN